MGFWTEGRDRHRRGQGLGRVEALELATARRRASW